MQAASDSLAVPQDGATIGVVPGAEAARAGLPGRGVRDETRRLALRRGAVAAACLLLWLAAGGSAWWALTWWTLGGVPGPAGLAVLVLFLLGLPWSLLVLVNAGVGAALLAVARDPAGAVNPVLRAAAPDAPIVARTAICVAIRHEDVPRVLARAAAMLDALAATGWGDAFALHLLSDSTDPAAIRAEEAGIAALRARLPHPDRLRYRRRADNAGFKAGNLQDFAAASRGEYAFMLVLDADSLMSGAAILRLVRAMQASPCLGILQTLVVGRPAASPFARIFQFGMRHGMRTHTLGAAWWQGPDGPFWGHNALLRVEAFLQCRLPALPGPPPLGGPILSHDQVEAALMRAAGWEVRVVPRSGGSWEENPPDLLGFIRRDLRWGQGNIQYLRLLRRPGFRAMGRFQLANALLMYAGPPCWSGMMLAGVLDALRTGRAGVAAAGFAGYLAMVAMGWIPRGLGVLGVLADARQRRRYGGGARLLAGAGLDLAFTLLTCPVLLVAETRFLAGLALGRAVGWDAQERDGTRVVARDAARLLWPQALAGLVVGAALAWRAPAALAWAAPVLLAWVLAVPVACVTADRRLGRWLRRRGLCAVPDERDPAAILRRVAAVDGPA